MNALVDQTCLVTGALGWAGSRLVHSLVRGLQDDERFRTPATRIRVRCLVEPGQDASVLRALGNNVQVSEGDLRNLENCRTLCAGAKSAILFHTAGVIHPRRVSDFFSINVEGTRNLLQAAAEAGVRRIVALSSNSPFGFNPYPDHLFDEWSPYRPYQNYGRSKLQMELALRLAQESGTLETVVLRPPWFYGPHQPPRQTLFFKMIRDGRAPIVGDGENLRSMVYVDNLCQGLLLAATTEWAAGETYWIADRAPYSMNQVIATVEHLLETEFGHPCKHGRLKLPRFAGSMAELADTCLQALGMYHQKVHVLSEMGRSIACSVQKAERELGYAPHVSLEEGMRRSLAWCAEAGLKF